MILPFSLHFSAWFSFCFFAFPYIDIFIIDINSRHVAADIYDWLSFSLFSSLFTFDFHYYWAAAHFLHFRHADRCHYCHTWAGFLPFIIYFAAFRQPYWLFSADRRLSFRVKIFHISCPPLPPSHAIDMSFIASPDRGLDFLDEIKLLRWWLATITPLFTRKDIFDAFRENMTLLELFSAIRYWWEEHFNITKSWHIIIYLHATRGWHIIFRRLPHFPSFSNGLTLIRQTPRKRLSIWACIFSLIASRRHSFPW